MSITPTPFATLVATVVAAVTMIQCSPAAPAGAPSTVSSVTLSATSVGAGTSGQGTVNLAFKALAGGADIALSSSNPAVATVQTSVTIPAGSTSITFPVAALTTGTTNITASLNGSSMQSPMLSVIVGPVTLSSISVSSATVVGGNILTGTVALNAAAPPGGALVTLSAGDPIVVPPSVNVPAGSQTALFTISTKTVGTAIDGTINGSFGGGFASIGLSVTGPTAATANFGTTGPTESETCTMTNGGSTLNCTFNGSTSTAPGTIIAWDWTYGLAATFAQTTSGPALTMPSVDCSLMPAPPLPAGGVQWFTMTVTLKVHDDQGNVSSVAVDNGVRLLPQGVCGF